MINATLPVKSLLCLKRLWNHNIKSISPRTFLSTQIRLVSVIFTFFWIHISGYRPHLLFTWWMNRLFPIFKVCVLEFFWKSKQIDYAARFSLSQFCSPLLMAYQWCSKFSLLCKNLQRQIGSHYIYILIYVNLKDTPLPGSKK